VSAPVVVKNHNAGQTGGGFRRPPPAICALEASSFLPCGPAREASRIRGSTYTNKRFVDISFAANTHVLIVFFLFGGVVGSGCFGFDVEHPKEKCYARNERTSSSSKFKRRGTVLSGIVPRLGTLFVSAT